MGTTKDAEPISHALHATPTCRSGSGCQEISMADAKAPGVEDRLTDFLSLLWHVEVVTMNRLVCS